MTVERNKNNERQITGSDILDRFVDGKIIDTAEMYDRWMLAQQVGLLLSVPRKRTPTRVR